jgi:hypothetical protein
MNIGSTTTLSTGVVLGVTVSVHHTLRSVELTLDLASSVSSHRRPRFVNVGVTSYTRRN